MLKLTRLTTPTFLQHCTRLLTHHHSNTSHLSSSHNSNSSPSSSPDTQPDYVSVLPEGTNKKNFLRKPADSKQRQRFVELKRDIVA